MPISATVPVLEPNLHRPLRHVNFLCDSFTHNGCGGRVLIKLNLQSDELVLGGTLALLVLLLLCKSALSRRSARGRAVRRRGYRSRGGRRRGRLDVLDYLHFETV